jgi:hypothetical protein
LEETISVGARLPSPLPREQRNRREPAADGLRLRLKASFRTAGYPRQARIVLEALKRYGMMVSDNGSDW